MSCGLRVILVAVTGSESDQPSEYVRIGLWATAPYGYFFFMIIMLMDYFII